MTIVAHGAAGVWDEIGFLLCPLIFLGVLIIAGRRRRPEVDNPDDPSAPDPASASDSGERDADGRD